MLVALPSAIAFGVAVFTAASPQLAGAGALAGIIGAAALGVVTPLVGRNGGFISGPCAPAAAVLSALALQLADHRLAAGKIVELLALTALVSSLLQIAYGIARAGQIIKYIPYQVVNGYLSGVALIIALAQIPNLLGVSGHSRALASLFEPREWNPAAVAVAIVTIATMTLAPRVTRVIPATIVGLAAGIGTYFTIAAWHPEMLRLTGNTLVVGPIETGVSFLDLVSTRVRSLASIAPGDIRLVAGAALTLSVILSIDTLKTGVVLDALRSSRHDSNRELIAQGTGNLASFLGGGMPGSAEMGPTLVNMASGGRTMWSGFAEGAFVLAGFLALRGAIAWVPLATLAGILLVIAWRMFDFGMFRLLRVPGTRLDFFVIAAGSPTRASGSA